MDIRYFAVLQFDCVDEVVFGVAGHRAGVVEADVGDGPGSSMVVLVGAAFFVENEFHTISNLESLFSDGLPTYRVIDRES